MKDSDFAYFFEDGAKLKISSEIKIPTFNNSNSADLIQTTQSKLVLCLHDQKRKDKNQAEKIKQKSCFITYYSTNEMYVKVDKSQMPLLFSFCFQKNAHYHHQSTFSINLKCWRTEVSFSFLKMGRKWKWNWDLATFSTYIFKY